MPSQTMKGSVGTDSAVVLLQLMDARLVKRMAAIIVAMVELYCAMRPRVPFPQLFQGIILRGKGSCHLSYLDQKRVGPQ